MANIKGLSAMQMGDGASGNMALAVQTGILKILYDGGFAYQTATIANPRQTKRGSVSYQIPEILQAEDYGDGTTKFQIINSSLVEVPINIRRTVKWTYETFDYSRLGEWTSAVAMITNSVAMTIQNDLNLHFWLNIAEQFTASTGPLRNQSVAIPNLVKQDATIDEVRAAIKTLQWTTTTINKTWNKRALGIPRSELMIFLDTFADINIRDAYWNQPNKLGERVVADDLVGYQIGGEMYYYLDKMLGATINAGSSFSKDKTLDLKDYVGFIIHNEAVAMPFNLESITEVIDQDNANPRLIAKYQFGFGLIRPWLVYAITKTDHKDAKSKMK